HALLELLQTLLMFDAEALLLVHDHQTQVLELHVLRKQTMSADRDIDLARRNVGDYFFQVLGRSKAAEHLDPHRKWLEAVLKRLEMLEAEDGRRSQHCDLLPIPQGLERGPHHHFRLAESYVAAEQPVHGLPALHISLDILDGGKLISSLG